MHGAGVYQKRLHYIGV